MIKHSASTYKLAWYLGTSFVPHDKVLYLIYHALNWLFSVNYMEQAGGDNDNYDLLIVFTVTVLGFVLTVDRRIVFEI
jgi:hypothetical protein